MLLIVSSLIKILGIIVPVLVAVALENEKLWRQCKDVKAPMS